MNGGRRLVRTWIRIFIPVIATLFPISAAMNRSVAQEAMPQVFVQTHLLPTQSHPGIEVTGLNPEELETLSRWQNEERLPTDFLKLFVEGQTSPVLGKVRIEESRLVLEPRFRLQPGTSFVVRFQYDKLNPSSSPIEFRFSIPHPVQPEVAPRLTGVYPSSDKLPQNVLRMYLLFATPMARGRAYEFIEFVDEDGREIEEAYIRIEQELWNPEGNRLTILFDPGRIKRGLARHEELGTPFKVGQTVTLVVHPGWPDATGTQLEQEFRKSFLVTNPERSQPLISRWQMELPPARSREPLVVRFDRPFDFAQLHHAIEIARSSNAPVAGAISIGNEELSVTFVPDENWIPGDYCLVIDPDLEDRSGNSFEQPFEVEIDAAESGSPPETTMTFSIQ